MPPVFNIDLPRVNFSNYIASLFGKIFIVCSSIAAYNNYFLYADIDMCW